LQDIVDEVLDVPRLRIQEAQLHHVLHEVLMDGNELIHVGQAVTAATRRRLKADPHQVFELESELIADLLDRPRLDVILKVV